MTNVWNVTGANGYLGGELCRGLLRANCQVRAFARAGRNLGDLRDLGASCHPYEALAETITPGDTVVHCAGKVGDMGAWENFTRTNVDWSVELFDAATAAGATCFIYVSSIAAMGYRNRPGDPLLNEESKPDLIDGEFYGRSKLMAEDALTKRAEPSPTRLVVLRPGLIYGHRPFGATQRWLRRGIVIDPRQRMPLVHVESLTSSVLAVAGTTAASGVFLVVDEEQPTLGELNRLRVQLGNMNYRPWTIGTFLARVLSNAAMIRSRTPHNHAQLAAAQLMRTRRIRYSTDRLRERTGWKPVVDLESGLRSCLPCPVPGGAEGASK